MTPAAVLLLLFSTTVPALLLPAAAVATDAAAPPPAVARKNVLYFLIDDLRPQMKLAYRQDMMHTPAFDQLAKESLVFSRAFCQVSMYIDYTNNDSRAR